MPELSADDPKPCSNQLTLCKIPWSRAVVGNQSKKFLEEIFIYEREVALARFFYTFNDLERQRINQILEPYADTILLDKQMAQFLLRKWSDQEAESIVKSLQEVIGEIVAFVDSTKSETEGTQE